jgi:hypothetical protein
MEALCICIDNKLKQLTNNVATARLYCDDFMRLRLAILDKHIATAHILYPWTRQRRATSIPSSEVLRAAVALCVLVDSELMALTCWMSEWGRTFVITAYTLRWDFAANVYRMIDGLENGTALIHSQLGMQLTAAESELIVGARHHWC